MVNLSRSSRVIIKRNIKVNKRFTDNRIYRLLPGVMPSFGFHRNGTPCSSLPQTNKTSLPCNLK
jgi:hypothetical protein